jgi:hypothetical protein
MIAGAAATLILILLGLLHFYWAVGGKLGKGSVIPTCQGRPVLRPGFLGGAAVGLLLLAMAAIPAARIGWIEMAKLPVMESGIRFGTWLTAGVFALRAIGDFRYVGFCKQVRDSRFARLDTLVYSPLCAVLALLIGFAAGR